MAPQHRSAPTQRVHNGWLSSSQLSFTKITLGKWAWVEQEQEPGYGAAPQGTAELLGHGKAPRTWHSP